MKFRVMRSDFLKELQRVQSISPATDKSNPPILAHIKITSIGDTLEIFGTNLDMGYKSRIPAVIGSEGAMTLEARKTNEIFRELSPDGEVEVDEGTRGWAVISMPGVIFRVATLPHEDYPASPIHTEEKFVSLEAGVLREMINRTDFAISPDESMRTLSGALFHTVGENLLMVATDGHRLAKAEKKCGLDVQMEEAIIPRRAIAEIKKLLEEFEDEDKIQIKREGDHLILKKGEAVFYCRLINGSFPDYNQVVPTDFKKQAIINREKFQKALRRVSILSNDRSKPVTIALRKEEMEIRSNSPEMGEAKENLKVKYDNEEVEIGYNARYLIEALGAMKEEEVVFDLIDAASAAVLRGTGNEEYLCVVMPMKV